MPKLMVVFFGAENLASTLAEAAWEGARAVRFMEADIRAGSPQEPITERRHQAIDTAERLFDYDAIVFSAPAAGKMPADLDALLAALEQRQPADAYAHTVFAVVGGENTLLAQRVLRLGGIMVSEPRGIDDPIARARKTGHRAAHLVEWIRHARSHQHHH